MKKLGLTKEDFIGLKNQFDTNLFKLLDKK